VVGVIGGPLRVENISCVDLLGVPIQHQLRNMTLYLLGRVNCYLFSLLNKHERTEERCCPVTDYTISAQSLFPHMWSYLLGVVFKTDRPPITPTIWTKGVPPRILEKILKNSETRSRHWQVLLQDT